MMSNKVSRRQFMSYTLMGVGGFMASGMLMPMVRFAIDPVLQKKDGWRFHPDSAKSGRANGNASSCRFHYQRSKRCLV